MILARKIVIERRFHVFGLLFHHGCEVQNGAADTIYSSMTAAKVQLHAIIFYVYKKDSQSIPYQKADANYTPHKSSNNITTKEKT